MDLAFLTFWALGLLMFSLAQIAFYSILFWPVVEPQLPALETPYLGATLGSVSHLTQMRADCAYLFHILTGFCPSNPPK